MTPAQQQVLCDNTARAMTGVSREIKGRHIEHCSRGRPGPWRRHRQGLGARMKGRSARSTGMHRTIKR
jgi:catalase